MDGPTALSRLKAIRKPILHDGGNWKFGHVYSIFTARGVFTVDCTAYEPIHGPIKVSKKRCVEIKKLAKNEENIDELEHEEQLFLIHHGKPGKEYWAFQPFDEAPLDEYTFSSNKKIVESELIATSMDGEIEEWDDMDEDTLKDWAAELASHDRAAPRTSNKKTKRSVGVASVPWIKG